MLPFKNVVLLSGGMDSATLLGRCIDKEEKVECLFFHYGSKHNSKELQSAIDIAEYYDVKLRTIDITFINGLFKSDLLLSGGEIPEGHYADESMKQTVVPFRNGIMLSIAAGYAESIEANFVSIASHAGDHPIYPDCRPAFREFMNLAIKHGTNQKVRLMTPFVNIDKTEIVKIGMNNFAKGPVPYELTWSCYKGVLYHCGKCGTCVERKEAFELAGVKDPTRYES